MADGSRLGILRQLLGVALGAVDGTGRIKVTTTATGGTGTRNYSLYGALAVSQERSVISNTGPGNATLGGFAAGKVSRVVMLEWACDHDYDVRLKIQPRDNTGSSLPLNVVYSGGTNGYPAMTVAMLRANPHPWFEIVTDNPASAMLGSYGYGAGVYKVVMKAGVYIPFGNGGDITVLNLSATTAHNATILILNEEQN